MSWSNSEETLKTVVVMFVFHTFLLELHSD